MGKPNSLPTFSANLLTWTAARWLPRSPSTKVRSDPPPQGASLFELQFAPPPCATEAAFHSQQRPCTTLSKCPRACPLCCHLGLRTLVLPHGLWALFAITIASRKDLRGPKGGESATKAAQVLTQGSYCVVTTQDISFVRLVFSQNAQWIIAPDALRPVPCGRCLSPITTRYRPSETCGKQCRDAPS